MKTSEAQTAPIQRESQAAAERPHQHDIGGNATAVEVSPRIVAQARQIATLFGHSAQRAMTTPNERDARPNRTGLPGQLKAGIESLSGLDLSNVRVHSNSNKPAQLNALAYAQGNDIHLGPGQQQHLPHEAWHVVQQMQGRVKPTLQAAGVPVNDDPALEREADQMGNAALHQEDVRDKPAQRRSAAPVVQRMLPPDGLANTKGYYNAQKNITPYAGGRPANFSTKFKANMVEHEWHGAYNKETDLWHVVTSGQSEVVLPTNAIQIDHTVPWDTIESRLKENPTAKLSSSLLNKSKAEKYVTPDGSKYTIYAARMYYHDVSNLKPMAGSENASKGAKDAVKENPLAAAWQNRAARSAGLHHEMVQSAFIALRDWSSDALAVTELLNNFDTADNALINAEDYFKSY